MDNALSENPNCSETCVTFRLVGDLVDPVWITGLTGITPTSTGKKGETYVGIHTRKTYSYQTGAWCVSSADAVASTSVERHLIYLLDLLEPAKARIASAMAQSSARADIHIYWVSSTGTGGPIVTATLLRRIAELHCDLDFEFQGPYDDSKP